MENTNIAFMNRIHLKQIDHRTLNGRQIWDWKNKRWDGLIRKSQMSKVIYLCYGS